MKIIESFQRLALNNIKVGDKIPNLQLKIEQKTYDKYNQLINESNPLHLDKKYARKLGFKDILIAGNFLYAHVQRWLINWVDNIKLINKFTIRFENPVFSGDILNFKGQVKKVSFLNNDRAILCKYIVEKSRNIPVIEGNLTLIEQE